MAYDPRTGQWKPESESVSQRVTGLMSQNNPLMKQARTQGRQESNRRGLLNSSMGVGAAQSAAMKQAVPIASQEAQQASQANRNAEQLISQERISSMDIAAREREKMASLSAAYENTYSQMVSTVMNNHKLPSDARQEYIEHAGRVRDSNLALLEQMYGVQLDWGTPGTPTYVPPEQQDQGGGSGGPGGGSGNSENPRVGQIRTRENNLEGNLGGLFGAGGNPSPSMEVWDGEQWRSLNTGGNNSNSYTNRNYGGVSGANSAGSAGAPGFGGGAVGAGGTGNDGLGGVY